MAIKRLSSSGQVALASLIAWPVAGILELMRRSPNPPEGLYDKDPAIVIGQWLWGDLLGISFIQGRFFGHIVFIFGLYRLAVPAGRSQT